MCQMTDSHPAVMLAGKEVEADFAGREVLIKAKMKAEKVAWDDSAAEQDSIPAQRGPAQTPSAITAPDFGGETVTTRHNKLCQVQSSDDVIYNYISSLGRLCTKSRYCRAKLSLVMLSKAVRDC